jgi:hypothetical protein
MASKNVTAPSNIGAFYTQKQGEGISMNDKLSNEPDKRKHIKIGKAEKCFVCLSRQKLYL